MYLTTKRVKTLGLRTNFLLFTSTLQTVLVWNSFEHSHLAHIQYFHCLNRHLTPICRFSWPVCPSSSQWESHYFHEKWLSIHFCSHSLIPDTCVICPIIILSAILIFSVSPPHTWYLQVISQFWGMPPQTHPWVPRKQSNMIMSVRWKAVWKQDKFQPWLL